MYCTKCGKEIADGSTFCPHCGKKLDGNQSSFIKSHLKIIIGAAAVLVIAVGIFCFTKFSSSSSESSKISEEEQFKQALISNSYCLNQSIGNASDSTSLTFYEDGTVKWVSKTTVGFKVFDYDAKGTYTIDYDNKLIHTTFDEDECTLTTCKFEYSGDEVVLVINGNRWRWK